MKIDKNNPAYPVITPSGNYYSGIPLRLEIASRFMAAILPMPGRRGDTAETTCAKCLKLADQLIEQHNKSCEGG